MWLVDGEPEIGLLCAGIAPPKPVGFSNKNNERR
jgi:hypothetical protein